MTLEMIISVCNPTDELDKTIESLATQTDKDFSVLISDNYSTQGQERIAHAQQRLEQRGVKSWKAKPSKKLECVEHWNWIHSQSKGDWFKPLSAGDRLEPGYVAHIRKTVSGNLSCRYIDAPRDLSGNDPNAHSVSSTDGWRGCFRSPPLMRELLMRDEVKLGPLACAAYERTAFFALGGYPAGLEPSGDLFFFRMLAANFGVFGLPVSLVHTQLKSVTCGERITSHFAFAYYAWTEDYQFSFQDCLRLLTGVLAFEK